MISILIKAAKRFGLDQQKIISWTQDSLKKHGFQNGEVSLFFVEPQKMKALNKKYRQIDYPTSVLTFFQGQATPEKNFWLGDIVICPLVAKEKNLTIKFLLNHGIKNLLSEISAAKSK
ncbi:hypothetical protein FJZ41_01645 [Candidatus Shapirobacteria bacterium]|nr:hypothetical protein [Candidatus Shapirobacteria bacterium]